jgi:hypothetical protein
MGQQPPYGLCYIGRQEGAAKDAHRQRNENYQQSHFCCFALLRFYMPVSYQLDYPKAGILRFFMYSENFFIIEIADGLAHISIDQFKEAVFPHILRQILSLAAVNAPSPFIKEKNDISLCQIEAFFRLSPMTSGENASICQPIFFLLSKK